MKVTCPHCGGDFDAHPRREDDIEVGAGDGPLGDDEMRCPKCGDRQPDAEACRTCGLRADRMGEYHAPGAEVSERLRELWNQVEASWDDDSAHDRFVEAASVDGAFAFAARCYRGAAAARPGDSRAQARMARVSRMAEAALMAAGRARPRRGEDGKDPYRGVVMLLIALVFLAAVGGAILVYQGLGRDDGPTAAPPRAVDGARGHRPAVPPALPAPRKTGP